MRDAVLELKGNPEKINPICPADLVIDHSVQVDFARTSDALSKNQNLEFERNKERFTFLKVSYTNKVFIYVSVQYTYMFISGVLVHLITC